MTFSRRRYKAPKLARIQKQCNYSVGACRVASGAHQQVKVPTDYDERLSESNILAELTPVRFSPRCGIFASDVCSLMSVVVRLPEASRLTRISASVVLKNTACCSKLTIVLVVSSSSSVLLKNSSSRINIYKINDN